MATITEDWLRECVSTDDLAAYLTAPGGWWLGVYPDGSVHVGDSVGREIDPEERPVALAKCEGLGQLDMTWWREGWECDHLDDAEVIRDCCEHGDIEGPLESLLAKLMDD